MSTRQNDAHPRSFARKLAGTVYTIGGIARVLVVTRDLHGGVCTPIQAAYITGGTARPPVASRNLSGEAYITNAPARTCGHILETCLK